MKRRAVGVAYHQIDGVPGEYFLCPTHQCTLSADRCVAMFEAALSGQVKIDRHRACASCEIGGAHAGRAAMTAQVVRRLLCARCHCQAPRLLRGALCVSCYNREREVLSGRNGKGVAPHPVETFWGVETPAKTLCVHVLMASDVSPKADKPYRALAANTLELALCVLRDNPGAMFARAVQAVRDVGPLRQDPLIARRKRRCHSDLMLMQRGMLTCSGYSPSVISPLGSLLPGV